jgi:hypothetical protein
MKIYQVFNLYKKKNTANIKKYAEKEKKTSLIVILFIVINIIFYLSLEALDNLFSYRTLSDINKRLVLTILEVI